MVGSGGLEPPTNGLGASGSKIKFRYRICCKRTQSSKLRLDLVQLVDQLSDILNFPGRRPLSQLDRLRVPPLSDPFVPGRATHRNDARIVLAADDVAQTEEADFGVGLGFHNLLL